MIGLSRTDMWPDEELQCESNNQGEVYDTADYE